MVKIGILDDDAKFANELKEQINRFAEEWNVTVMQTLENVELEDFDAFFVDIELDNINSTGFQIANEIRKFVNIPIIFVSTHEKYAFDGYRYNPFDFLSKNKLPTYLVDSLTRLQCKLAAKEEYILMQNSYGTDMQIRKSEIEYAYRDGNYIIAVVKNCEFRFRSSMKEFTALLPDSFYQPIVGDIVNMDMIDYIDRDRLKVYLKNGKFVQVSRLKIKEFIITYGRRTLG